MSRQEELCLLGAVTLVASLCKLPATFLPPACSVGEEARGQAAFEREYEDDHSWEDLEEDEFGNLRALVSRNQ